jgi:hypothetical protein
LEELMASKYDRLLRVLEKRNEKTISFAFSEIETIVGFKLPKSARQYQEWWANASPGTGHPHAQAWTSAGRKARVNLTAETVAFERVR